MKYHCNFLEGLTFVLRHEISEICLVIRLLLNSILASLGKRMLFRYLCLEYIRLRHWSISYYPNNIPQVKANDATIISMC